jgi:hypothetical protein
VANGSSSVPGFWSLPAGETKYGCPNERHAEETTAAPVKAIFNLINFPIGAKIPAHDSGFIASW